MFAFGWRRDPQSAKLMSEAAGPRPGEANVESIKAEAEGEYAETANAEVPVEPALPETVVPKESLEQAAQTTAKVETFQSQKFATSGTEGKHDAALRQHTLDW